MNDGQFTEALRSAISGRLEEMRDEVHKIAADLSDEKLWKRPLEPGNSVGHLVLHLTGNLNHFVGAQLGHTGYVREREREFTEMTTPSRQLLLQNLDQAVATFRRVVGSLTEEQLMSPHPEQRFGSVLKALVSILTHFALHRGQMSYIARLMDTGKSTIH